MSDVTLLPFGNIAPDIPADVFLASGVRIIGNVKLGSLTNIWFNAVLRGDVNYIRIGARTNVQDNTVIHVTDGGNPTIIGDNVTIGHSAIIHACTLEDNCLIGMGATILDGAVIRKHTLVGAGAVVPPGKSYPPGSLLIGAPAVVKRGLSVKEMQEIDDSAQHYVDLAMKYRL